MCLRRRVRACTSTQSTGGAGVRAEKHATRGFSAGANAGAPGRLRRCSPVGRRGTPDPNAGRHVCPAERELVVSGSGMEAVETPACPGHADSAVRGKRRGEATHGRSPPRDRCGAASRGRAAQCDGRGANRCMAVRELLRKWILEFLITRQKFP